MQSPALRGSVAGGGIIGGLAGPSLECNVYYRDCNTRWYGESKDR